MTARKQATRRRKPQPDTPTNPFAEFLQTRFPPQPSAEMVVESAVEIISTIAREIRNDLTPDLRNKVARMVEQAIHVGVHKGFEAGRESMELDPQWVFLPDIRSVELRKRVERSIRADKGGRPETGPPHHDLLAVASMLKAYPRTTIARIAVVLRVMERLSEKGEFFRVVKFYRGPDRSRKDEVVSIKSNKTEYSENLGDEFDLNQRWSTMSEGYVSRVRRAKRLIQKLQNPPEPTDVDLFMRYHWLVVLLHN